MCAFSCVQVSISIYRYKVHLFLKTTRFLHHPVHSFRLLLTPPEMHCILPSLAFSCSWHQQEHVTFLCFLIPPVGLVEAAMVAAPEAGVSTLSMAQSYSLYVLLIVHCSWVMVNLSLTLIQQLTNSVWSLLAINWNCSLTNVLPKLFILT